MPARGFSVSAPRKPKPKAKVRAISPSEQTSTRTAQKRNLQAQVKKARVKVKAGAGPKADTGDVTRGTKVAPKPKGQIKRELEGSGKLVSLSQKASEQVEHAVPIVRIGKKLAGIVPGLGDLDERVAKDLVNLPAQVVPSLYVPAAAAVEAARGKPARAKKLWKDVKATDPVVNLAMGKPKKALELAKEHPGFAAAEVAGLKGTVGRGVTKVQRVAGKRPTVRAPAVVPGTDLKQHRSYSEDAFKRAAEKRKETRAVKRSDALRAEAKALEAKDPGKFADRITELRHEAIHGTPVGPVKFSPDPRRMTDAEIRKRASERVAVNETLRRENRAIVGHEAHRAITTTKPLVGSPKARARIMRENRATRQKPTAATTLAVQNITDMSVADLAKYKAEIAGQYEAHGAAGRKANRQLQAEIQKAIDKAPEPGKLREASAAYAKVIQPRTAGLVERGLLPKESAEKAPLVPYAVRKMGAKVTDEGPVHPTTGKPIMAAEIRAHMKAHDVPEPSYVTQAPQSGNAFFVSSGKPPSVAKVKRTGGATVKGTFNANPEVLKEGAARAQGLIDAADGFKATIHEFAHKPSLGKLKDKKAADAKARELSAETGVEYRPVRLQPFAGRQEQLQALLDRGAGEGLDAQAGTLQPVREAMEGAYRGEDGPGPWALIPRAAADEFTAHLQRMGSGPGAKVAQLVQQSFRRTVLSTSPTWVAGNVTEAALRMALSKSGPRSLKLGREVLKAVDELSPQLGRELRARAVGGGHFASADRLHVRRGADQFQGTAIEPLARALHSFWEKPGPKQAAQAWNGWTDLVFRQLNGRLESQFQTAMLGRALRSSGLMDPKLPSLSKTAVDQAARGLLDTNEQAAMGRAVERMYGKYDGFSAGTRWGIAMYTPFIAWTLNAVKFVTDVLPHDHPTVTALVAASEQWSEEWRRDHGLDLFMQEAVPGFLQGSIPVGEGGHQRAPHRFTPFGAFGDPLDTLGKAVLPQYQGILSAFKGEDWKGKEIRKPDGSPGDVGDNAREAANAFTEATVPLLGIVKRVAEKGPGSLNPLRATAPAKVRAKAGRPAGGDPVQKAIDDALSGGGGAVQSHIDQLIGP